jgi:hypothetical protein
MKPRSKRWSMLGVKSSPFSPYAAGGLARGNAGQPRHDPRLHNMSHDHRGATIDIGAWLTVWRKRTNMM